MNLQIVSYMGQLQELVYLFSETLSKYVYFPFFLFSLIDFNQWPIEVEHVEFTTSFYLWYY